MKSMLLRVGSDVFRSKTLQKVSQLHDLLARRGQSSTRSTTLAADQDRTAVGLTSRIPGGIPGALTPTLSLLEDGIRQIGVGDKSQAMTNRTDAE